MIVADRAAPPPQAQVMHMMTAAWLSQTIAAVTRLGVPDLVGRHGPLSARQLAEQHGVEARPEFLERALRACASAGIFTEARAGLRLTSIVPINPRSAESLIDGVRA